MSRYNELINILMKEHISCEIELFGTISLRCSPSVRVVRYVGVRPPRGDGLGQVRDQDGALAGGLPRRLPRQAPLNIAQPSPLSSILMSKVAPIHK